MKQKAAVYRLTSCALMAAVMCVLGPMAIPIGPIPVSLTNLVIYLAIYLLGKRGTLISYGVYLALGAAGMPVFSGYQGGLGKLAGPTGGYLVGFVLMILLSGLVMERARGNLPITMAGMAVGTAVAYLFGTVWFVLVMECQVWYALTVCVFPFIPFDLAKIVAAAALGRAVRGALVRGKLLPERS